MKNLKRIVIATFILSSLPGFSQTPKLPSIESVFEKVKANPKVYESLKKNYKINTAKDCKFEMIMTIGGGDVITSDWSSYKTDYGYKLNYYWPDDRAYTVFTITTPKNTEGVIYTLPLVVEYSRIKNDVLQNNWDYYWWYFDNPYSVKGGKEQALFKELLLKKLSTMKGDIVIHKRNDIRKPFEYFTSIKSITKTDKTETRQLYSNVEYVYYTYEIIGETTEYEDNDQSIVKANYPNSKGYFEVTFKREKENGKTKDWVFSEFIGGFQNYVEKGEPSSDKQLYETIGTSSFNTIYQKEKTPRKLPYYSKTYNQQFSEGLTQSLVNLYHNKPDAEVELKKYIVPGDDKIIPSIKAIFNEMKKTFVELAPETLNNPNHDGIYVDLYVNESSIEKSEVRLVIKGFRKPWTSDKNLKKIYKSSAMSKATLDKWGAKYNLNNKSSLSTVFINGEFKITSSPELKENIPF